MPDYTVTGNPAIFNENVIFYKDVTIYGQLYYDFTTSGLVQFQSINVSGDSQFNTATFGGVVNFNSDVVFNNEINNLIVKNLTAEQNFNIGLGGTILTNNYGSNIGIGSTIPQQSLDISGSVHISQEIYDSSGKPGIIGAFLTKDAQGIKWTAFQPSFTEGVFVYNEGTLVGVQSFRGLNLRTGRGAGVTTDPIQGFVNTDNSHIADIFVYDYWDFNAAGDIYRLSNVGINNSSPSYTLDVNGSTNITGILNVQSNATLSSNLTVNGNTNLNTLNVSGLTTLNTLNVSGISNFYDNLFAYSNTSLNTLNVSGVSSFSNNVNISGITSLTNTLKNYSPTELNSTLNVTGISTFSSILNSTNQANFNKLYSSGISTFGNSIYLNSSLYDSNNSAAIGKTDYRLASVGTGVSWRPPGVQTLRTIWVTLNGNDSNSGLLEGDAKATVGAAASIAQPGDTIMIRSGVYYENNPIGLRTDVCVSGQDLRLVTIVPNNLQKDVFQVRRGCLIENLSFSCSNISIANTGGGAVAFATTDPTKYAVSGYTVPGQVNEGPSGRWRSPYVRNCTNFMKGSIGMRIDGHDATASTPGNDLKCMVCDSFTQYNEAGIGVSITNNGYAQLVSIFTINCHIGIYCDTGGSCDITNSNSSFGDYGLVANGLGALEFTGKTLTATTNSSDTFVFQNIKDSNGSYRTPYNGQALWFQIPVSTGILTSPMVNAGSITVINGGSGFSVSAPPSITIVDKNNGNSVNPLGPQGIIAQFSPTIDSTSGTITAIDVISSGQNYLPTQNMVVAINGIPQSTSNFVVNMSPIYYSVSSATTVTSSGISTVVLNQFVPYLVSAGSTVSMYRISRIQTSSHSFEYIGSGTDINTSNPFQGALYNAANEVVALNGALIPYTSTNQSGNFEIGKGIVIDQTTNTIRGRDFNRSIQAQITPLLIALR